MQKPYSSLTLGRSLGKVCLQTRAGILLSVIINAYKTNTNQNIQQKVMAKRKVNIITHGLSGKLRATSKGAKTAVNFYFKKNSDIIKKNKGKL